MKTRILNLCTKEDLSVHFDEFRRAMVDDMTNNGFDHELDCCIYDIFDRFKKELKLD